MRKISILLFLFCVMILSKKNFAQYHDANWVISYGTDSINNNTLVYFPPGGQTPQVSLTNGYIPFLHTNANISDQHGNLLFITNGINIYNKLYQPIPGGIVQTGYTTMYAASGMNRPHQYLFLPWPGDTNLYVLFYCVPELNQITSGACANGWGWLSTHLYYTVLDKNMNGGLGGIVSANNIAFVDTLIHLTGLSAVKHANGRDWWLLTKENCNNAFKRVLFTPNGVQLVSSQNIGPMIFQLFDGGMANFSPDGTMYYQVRDDYNLNLFKFDRCTGLLSDRLALNSNGIAEFYSAFSPNSRFLYRGGSPSGLTTLQYDLSLYYQPGGVQNSRRLINPPFDSSACDSSGPFTASAACAPELAPNGKIYFGHCYPCNLSVINSPDSLDTLCNMEYNTFVLPSPHVALPPYHPNYRLGPVAGSVCDSLSVGVNEMLASNVLLYPNPTKSDLNIKLGKDCKNISINLLSLQGQLLFAQKWTYGNAVTLALPPLSKGLYLVEIICDEGRVVKKVVVD
jgi:hypothetical protein